MATFSTTQPSIRARILPRFPAQVLAGTGIAISKENGRYVFSTTALVNVPLSVLAPMPESTLVGRGSGGGAGPPVALAVSGGLTFTGATGVQLSQNQRLRSIAIQLTATGDRDVMVPFNCTIVKVNLLGAPAGNATLDIWKAADFAAFPPTVANSIITPGALPTITGGVKYQDTALVGWNTTIAAGSILRFHATLTTINQFAASLDVVAS